MIRIEAITREEVLLQSIAEGKEVTLEPKTRLEWWLKKIAESGGSGGVSSWNDLTDKPFGKEEGTTFLEESTFEFTDGGNGSYNYQGSIQNELIEGKSYIVKFDDVQYGVKAVKTESNDFTAIYIGNYDLMDDPNSGEPFAIGTISNGDSALLIIGTINSGTSHSIAIYEDTLKKISKEYLPSVAEQLSEVSEVKKTSIEFDEDLDGKTTVDLGGMYMVKVCDAIPSEESILSGSITILADGTESTIDVSTINSNGRYTNTDDFYVIGDECIIIKNANVGADLCGVNFPEVGVWFAYISSANYVKSLNVEYTETTATYETIPEESIPELSSFTMVSSSGKKYKVTIDDTGTLSATGITE